MGSYHSQWENYSRWSNGQLPPVFSRSRWYSEWKKTRYTNEKLKLRLGWVPKRVSTGEGFALIFRELWAGLHGMLKGCHRGMR